MTMANDTLYCRNVQASSFGWVREPDKTDPERGGKKRGCDSTTLWIAAAALALITTPLVVRWFLRRRAKRVGGGGGPSADNPQDSRFDDMSWDEIFSIRRENGQGEQTTSPSTKKLQVLAKSLQWDREYNKGVRFYSRRHGMHIDFCTMKDVYYFDAEGLAQPQDVVPIAYYWLQEELRSYHRNSENISWFFVEMAKAHGANQQQTMTDEEMGSKSDQLQLDNLIQRVNHQLEQGCGLFHLEAMVAHAASYFADKTKGATHGKMGRSWDAAQRDNMTKALKAFSTGDFADVVSSVESSRKAFADLVRMTTHDDSRIPYALLSMMVAELKYRMAACEGDIDGRRSLLHEVQVSANEAYQQFTQDGPSPLTAHALKLNALAVEGLQACTGSGHCRMVGTFVKRYGPTAASISGYPTNCIVLPHTSIIRLLA